MTEREDTILSGISAAEAEATTLQGLFTRLIDFAVDLLLLFLLRMYLPPEVFRRMAEWGSVSLVVFVILVGAAYYLSFQFLFNKTIGMMVCRVKLLNGKLQPLSANEKLLSLFRTRFSPIKYYQER